MGKPKMGVEGATRYFTGIPCKRGHIAERRASNQCCVECTKENRRGKRLSESRNRYAKHREKVLASAYKSKLKTRYRLTPKEYADMLASQGGRCAICGSAARDKRNSTRLRLCIDHCHKTGKIRGLLCNGCNTGLGHLGDDLGHVLAAAAYLARQSSTPLAAQVLGALKDVLEPRATAQWGT